MTYPARVKYEPVYRRSLARAMRIYRAKMKLTQAQLAALTGTTLPYICRLENPDTFPTEVQAKKLRAVAKVVGYVEQTEKAIKEAEKNRKKELAMKRRIRDLKKQGE